MPKVTVVGAGNVGATCAHTVLRRGFADVALVDIDEGLAKGKALDLAQAGAIESYATSIVGGSDYRLTAGSDVVVITAGLPRRPGMTREELLDKNARIVSDVVERTLDASPDAVLIVVTNPLDLMVHLAHRRSGLDSRKVLGMGGILDTARFKHFIAEAAGVRPSEVEAMVIGSHSDSMVPLASTATVGGRPLKGLVGPEAVERIIEKTKFGGAEIVAHLRTGSAFYTPGAAAAEMVASVLLEKEHLLPACVRASGVYGLNGVYIGLPTLVCKGGVAEVVELPLDPVETEAFAGSVREIEAGLEALEGLL